VAYGYLSESAAAFPYGEALNNILRKIGFIDVIALPDIWGSYTFIRHLKTNTDIQPKHEKNCCLTFTSFIR
jgi:hypothetical protein